MNAIQFNLISSWCCCCHLWAALLGCPLWPAGACGERPSVSLSAAQEIFSHFNISITVSSRPAIHVWQYEAMTAMSFSYSPLHWWQAIFAGWDNLWSSFQISCKQLVPVHTWLVNTQKKILLGKREVLVVFPKHWEINNQKISKSAFSYRVDYLKEAASKCK